MNILVVGHGAREHAITEALARSSSMPCIFAYMKANNPGIAALSKDYRLGRYDEIADLVDFAMTGKVDWAIIGPEDPLALGVVDALERVGVPCVGPTMSLARLETSKSFTRFLLEKYGIPGNPRFRVFTSLKGIEEFIEEIGEVVIKPDGLTGGKGVLVQGDHFETRHEALRNCEEILNHHPRLVVEERLDGEEFSLQCFCDGENVVAMPAVQDHKRRFPGDTGPNTGGMGSYSCPNHRLPFLDSPHVEEALKITQRVSRAIYEETGEKYKGIMYGGFIVTAQGVKLLEYNARFGDPEAMNVLPIMKTDLVKICEAIIAGRLGDLPVEFDRKATVCKYVVPLAYGIPVPPEGDSSIGARIEIGETGKARVYYSSVEKRGDGLYMTSSRAVGMVGIAEDLPEAERIAEIGCLAVKGPVDHRPDIGTQELIEKRIRHMEKLRSGR